MNSNSARINFGATDKSIVFFGGTFDPIHLGHLIIAEQCREQFDLNKILFLPAGDPPHKERTDLSPGEIRYKMTAAAIAGNRNFKISTRELEREGPSYTARTIKEFEQQGYAVSLIIGADSLAEIFTWKNTAYILKTARLLVAQRPGYDIAAIKNNSKYRQYKPEIKKVDTGLLEISSSMIRARVKNNKSIRYMVPEPVRDIILSEELYLLNEK